MRFVVCTCGALLWVLGTKSVTARAAQHASLDRQEIAAALAEMEQLRSCYSLESSITYHYEVDGILDRSLVTHRLSDGDGRLRWQRWLKKPGRPTTETELARWDGAAFYSDVHRVDRVAPPHYVLFSAEEWGGDYVDDIENVLGLGIPYQVSPTTPRLRLSKAIANPDTPVTIEAVSEGGGSLIRVRIMGPWGGKGNGHIYDFDPSRQWLVTRIEYRVYQTYDQYLADESRNIMTYTTTKAQEIDGVWMPREVEMLTRMADKIGPDAKWEEYRATLRLDAITLHPEFTDDDFKITLDGMPDGTSVADARLGISYKLGQNLIYADGILHEVDAPIDHELTAREAEDLLASSTSLIDPELANVDLKPVGGNGLAWAGRIAGGATVALLAAVGVVLYRRRA